MDEIFEVLLQSIKNYIFLWKDSTFIRQLSSSNVTFILHNWKNQWEQGIEECVKILMNVKEITWSGDSFIWFDLRKTFKIVNILVNQDPMARASLVAQWLRIRLPMQGTRVRALIWEDPTCHGATKPVRHNYWNLCAQSPCSVTREATAMRSPRTTTKNSPCSPQLQKARAQQRRPNAAKNK